MNLWLSFAGAIVAGSGLLVSCASSIVAGRDVSADAQTDAGKREAAAPDAAPDGRPPAPQCTAANGSCLFTLASGQDHPSSIGIYQGTVYWTDEHAGTVMKMPASGGTPVTVATPAQQAVAANGASSSPTRVGPLFVAPPSLYWWAVSDTLVVDHSCPSGGPCSHNPGAAWQMSAPLSGASAPAQGVMVSGSVPPNPMSGIGGNADAVYFAAPTTWLMPGNSVAQASGNPFGVVGQGHQLYWTDRSAGTVTAGTTTAGSPPASSATLAAGQAAPSLIALAGNSIYWTNSGDGTVMQAPTAGGTTVTLAQGQGSPWGIAVSSSAVYWTDQSGAVMKVAPGGGTPVTLVSGQSTPYAIALDDTSVYFTTYVSKGSVMKLTEGCSCP